MKPRILLSVNRKKEYYIDAVNFCGGTAVAQYCPELSTDYAEQGRTRRNSASTGF